MSIKYGKTSRDPAGNLVDRKWGKKNDRLTFWKFGEQARFFIMETLLKYLPAYIDKENEICRSLMRALAISMAKWHSRVKKLPNYKLNGDKISLKFANSDLQLFLSSKTTGSNIISCIKNYFTIHKQRGTQEGIEKDIERYIYDEGTRVTYYNWEQCGWYLDVTYPEHNAEGGTYNSNTFLELDNMLDIVFFNNSGISDSEVLKVIKEEFIPVTINTRILIIRPHCIKWGEAVGGVALKFGAFKFGTPIKGLAS